MTDYYDVTGSPGQASFGSSSVIRAEFTAIGAGISDKLPPLTGSGRKYVRINAGGTALESTAGIDLATGNVFAIGGATKLSATALGSLVVDSSLTSVGTLSSLTVGGGITKLSSADATPAGTAVTTADDAVLGSSTTANTGLTVFSTGSGRINWGDAGSNAAGAYLFSHTADEHRWQIAGTGHLSLSATSLVLGTTGEVGRDITVLSTGTGRINWGDIASSTAGAYVFSHTADEHRWQIASTDYLTLSTTLLTVAADIKAASMQSGADQGAAGAAVGEMWHDTDDNTIKMGV